MSEKDEKIVEMERNKMMENKENIKDNDRREINDDKLNKYAEKLKEFKNFGYEKSEIITNDKDEPQKILIKSKEGKIIGTYDDNRLEIYEAEEFNKYNNIIKERQINEQNKENAKEINRQEKNENSENVIQEQLGSKYKVLSTISYDSGNKQVLDKVYSTEGIVGRIYKVKNEETGEISLAGMDCDGEVKLVDYYTKKDTEIKTINIVKDDNKIIQQGFKENLTLIPGEQDKAMVLKEKEAYIVGGLTKGTTYMIKMDETPMGGKKTSKEQDEIKNKSEKMDEVIEILDRFIFKGYMNENKKITMIEEIMNNGRDIDKDIEQLKKFEKEKDEKEEQKTDGIQKEDEEELDDSWARYGAKRSH